MCSLMWNRMWHTAENVKSKRVRIASALGMKLEIGLVKEGEGHEEIL